MTTFTLPPLPYADTALDPVISARTLGFHHGKHHKTYVDNLNKFIVGSGLEGLSLEEVVRRSHGDAAKKAIFNNSAQVWNHTFFWNSMKPGGGQPTGKIKELLERDFGSFDEFKTKFTTAANGQFGSGWAWLTYDGGKLNIEATSNAETPMARGVKCLLTIDVWEHAYYLDHQNMRAAFTEAVTTKLLNWDFANQNLA